MNCKNCGNLVSSNEKFCTTCGTPIEQVISVEGGVNKAPQIQSIPQQPIPQAQPAVVTGLPVAMPNLEMQVMAQPMEQVIQQPNVPTIAQPVPMPVQQSMGAVPMPNQPNIQSMVPNIPSIQQPTPKNKIILIIGALIVIVIIVIALYFILGKDKKENASNDNSNSNSSENSNSNSNDNESKIQTTYKAVAGSYVFTLPTNYIYEYNKDSDAVVLYDSTETWLTYIKTGTGNTATLTEDYIVAAISEEGNVVDSIETKTTNGKSAIVVNFTSEGQTGTYIYYKYSSTQLLYAYYANESKTHSTVAINDILDIFNNIKYSGSNNNIDDSKGSDGVIFGEEV